MDRDLFEEIMIQDLISMIKVRGVGLMMCQHDGSKQNVCELICGIMGGSLLMMNGGLQGQAQTKQHVAVIN